MVLEVDASIILISVFGILSPPSFCRGQILLPSFALP